MTSDSEIDFLDLVDTCLCTGIRKASRVISRLYDSYLVPSSLNIKQLAILLTIHGMNQRLHANDPDEYVTLAQISERLRIDKSTLSRNIRVLEKRGFTKLFFDDSNRKIKRVTVTEVGLQHVLVAYKYWVEVQDKIKAVFGENEFFDLLATINHLTDVLLPLYSTLGTQG